MKNLKEPNEIVKNDRIMEKNDLNIPEPKEIIEKNRIIAFIFIGLFFSLICFVNTPSFRVFKIIASLLLLFIMPSILISTFLQTDSKLTQIVYGIVINLGIWVIISTIFIQFSIPLTKFTISIVIYPYIILLLIRLIYSGCNLLSKKGLKTVFQYYNFKNLFKKCIKSNLFYFSIFLVLLAVFTTSRIPFVPADDDWFHMSLSVDFLDDGLISDKNLYWGKLSYHFLGSVFALFSDIAIINLGKYVGLLQLPFGCLLFYVFINNIIHNEKIATIVSFLFSFTTLGTIMLFTQYWPTSLVIFFGLPLTSMFYSRIQKFQKNKHFSKKEDLFYYSTQFLFSFGIIITHVTSFPIYVTPIIFIIVILSIKCHKFIKDLLFYILLFIINLFVNTYGLTYLSYLNIEFFKNFYWIILIGIPIIGFLLYRAEKYIEKITYSINDPKPEFFNPYNSTVKIEAKYYRKIIIPIVIFTGPIIYIVVNMMTKKYLPANVFIMIVDIAIVGIILASSILAINIYRQYNLVGKINFLYLICIGLFILSLVLLNANYPSVLRIVSLYIAFLFLGLGYYLLYNLTKWLKKPRNRKILLLLITINTITSISYQFTLEEHVNNSEASFVEDATKFMYPNLDYTDSSYVAGIFRWYYPFVFFSQESPIDYNQYDTSFIRPSDHIIIDENGTTINRIQAIYEREHQDNVFIIIDETYISRGLIIIDGKDYGKMTLEEIESYNTLSYINRVAVSTQMKTLFWVIPPNN